MAGKIKSNGRSPEIDRLGALTITLGAVIYLSKGLSWRYEDRHLAVIEQFRNPGNYVRIRFDELISAEFSDSDERRKLLIIGDSYGQDTVNAILETKLGG